MTSEERASLYLLAIEALAAALDAARVRAAGFKDEAEYWMLVADGIKHSHRCPNSALCSAADREHLTPCYRCRAHAAEARVQQLEQETR